MGLKTTKSVDYSAAHPAIATTSLPRRLAATVRNVATGVGPWRRYRSYQPLTIVILGMHRSGTSCICRMINLCGASLGPSVTGANWSNRAGHWEPRESVDLNEAILRLSGGSWDQPPDTLRVDLRFEWRMKGFLGRLHEDGTAVWKDPRTVLTFPLWKPLLQRYLVVAAFRNPLSVAQSLQRREANFPISRGLDLWKTYNARLLDIVSQEAEVFWFNFDAGVDHVVSRVRQVSERCRLVYSEEARASYSPELRTSDAQSPPLDREIGQMYERLQALSRSNLAEQPR